MNMQEIEGVQDVHRHLDNLSAGIENLRALPVWAQAAHDFLTYSPEAIRHQVMRWRERLENEPDEDGRIVAILIAARRIYRFEAGPDVDPEWWSLVVAKVGALEHPEDLAEALPETLLEPRYFSHVGHQRDEWPIRILPDNLYADG